MRNPATHEVELKGCTPEPLMAYLKALGILRIISEQKDPETCGWWKNEVFWLRSCLDCAGIAQFFLNQYEPTPVVGPWAGGSGFFKKDNKKAVKALSESASERVLAFRNVIEKVQSIIKQEQIQDKPRDEEKARLIRRYRNELPDAVVPWIDAAMVLQSTKQYFAPLLGTGGNDGRLDFTQNFMQRIVSLGLQSTAPQDNSSYSLLKNALFGTPTVLEAASVGQFAPGRAGGPNATQGMEGEASDNPWDFILTIEGALFFAGAAVRRFPTEEASRATFPFTVRPVGAGFASSAMADETQSRAEVWLPVWARPASSGELRALFGEGRAEISGRSARDATDFARAVAALGVDRGVTKFTRFGFMKRSGKAFLAAPLGRFEVIERPSVDLLREVDSWLLNFRSGCGAKDTPTRLISALHRMDFSVLGFCKYGGVSLFRQVLISLGGVERALASSERFRVERNLRPITGLSAAWSQATDAGDGEFEVARGLASVYDQYTKIGPLRINLEPVDWTNNFHGWAEKGRAVVWNSADLVS